VNQLISSNKLTMSSIDFLRNIINPARIESGENEVRNRDFIARIEDEIDDLPASEIIVRFGNYVKVYDLNTNQMMLIGMRESKVVRRKVLDVINNLENKKPAIPQTYAAALLEAGRLALENEKQAEQLNLAAPKVEFVDKFVTASTGSMGFREVAKLLKIKEPEFRLFLSEAKIMYRLGSNYVPYQHHIEAGRFEIKAGVSDSDHAYKQAKFTAKGIEWIAGLIAVYRVNQELKGV